MIPEPRCLLSILSSCPPSPPCPPLAPKHQLERLVEPGRPGNWKEATPTPSRDTAPSQPQPNGRIWKAEPLRKGTGSRGHVRGEGGGGCKDVRMMRTNWKRCQDFIQIQECQAKQKQAPKHREGDDASGKTAEINQSEHCWGGQTPSRWSARWLSINYLLASLNL